MFKLLQTKTTPEGHGRMDARGPDIQELAELKEGHTAKLYAHSIILVIKLPA